VKACHGDVEAVCLGLQIDRDQLDGWRSLH
jgi:hypothetical protein